MAGSRFIKSATWWYVSLEQSLPCNPNSTLLVVLPLELPKAQDGADASEVDERCAPLMSTVISTRKKVVVSSTAAGGYSGSRVVSISTSCATVGRLTVSCKKS